MSLPPIPLPSDPVNLAVIHGTLSSDPVTRELPSGDLVHNYEVTVRSSDGPADTHASPPVSPTSAVRPVSPCRSLTSARSCVDASTWQQPCARRRATFASTSGIRRA